jgi:hypothetical protein
MTDQQKFEAIRSIVPTHGRDRIFIVAPNWHYYRLFILKLSQLMKKDTRYNFLFLDRPSVLYGCERGSRIVFLDGYRMVRKEFAEEVNRIAARRECVLIDFDSRLLENIAEIKISY